MAAGFWVLDIETDWQGPTIALVGLLNADTGETYWSDVYPDPVGLHEFLTDTLPAGGKLVTFNGRDYDLKKITEHCGLDLATYVEHVDLRWLCAAYGLTNGLRGKLKE